MAISDEKLKIVINNYFKSECDVNTSIREAFEKGFRIGAKKGLMQIEADRKTEPSNSEKPNNSTISKMEQVETMSCQECKHWDCLMNADWKCTLKECHYEPKDEPQYSEDDMYWLSLAEDVANGKMSDAGANQAWLEYINRKTEPSGYNLSPVEDEPQTDCPWK